MTSTATAHLIAEALASIRPLLDSDTESVEQVEAPYPDATPQQAPAGVLLSAQVTPTCQECGKPALWQAEVVDGWERDGELIVQARAQREHGCGAWQEAAIAFIPLSEIESGEADFAGAVARLRSDRSEKRAGVDRAIRADLAQQLAGWLAELAGGAAPEGKPAGSDMDPGIWVGESGWEAWAFGCLGDEVIAVAESDLRAAR